MADKPNAGWKNLRPIRPGEVRNPKGNNGQVWIKGFYDYFGRKRVDDITDIDPAKKMGRKVKKTVRLTNIWAAVYRNALLGGDAAQKLIVEQMQGRARESVHVSGDGSFGGNMPPPVVMVLPDDGSGDDLDAANDDSNIAAILPDDTDEAGDAGDAGDEEQQDDLTEPGDPQPGTDEDR